MGMGMGHSYSFSTLGCMVQSRMVQGDAEGHTMHVTCTEPRRVP